MACKDTVGRLRRRCAEWESNQRLRCERWRVEWRRRCDDWQTEWEQRCDRWRTTTERRCDRWEEERTRECDDWFILFRWICLAWTWVSTWLCKAWSWITSTICVVWTWVSTLVCRAWAWVSSLICDLWVIVTTFVCRVWVIIIDLWCVIYCAFRRLWAPTEFSESKSECTFGWTSAYRASIDPKYCILTITLRIRLVAGAGVTAANLATVRALWEPAIENAWSGQFPLVLIDGTCICKQVTVKVDVQFVTSNEHHTVTVQAGSGRANMSTWFVNSTGGTAAHEAGHMFGNVDEYPAANCPNRVVTTDGSIMRNSQTGAVKQRHYESFARWLSNRTCCSYEAR